MTFESLVNSSSGKTASWVKSNPSLFESLVNSSSGKTPKIGVECELGLRALLIQVVVKLL